MNGGTLPEFAGNLWRRDDCGLVRPTLTIDGTAVTVAEEVGRRGSREEGEGHDDTEWHGGRVGGTSTSVSLVLSAVK